MNQVSKHVLDEIIQAIQNVQWGSIEIFMQDSEVVQITKRNIKKIRNGTHRPALVNESSHNQKFTS